MLENFLSALLLRKMLWREWFHVFAISILVIFFLLSAERFISGLIRPLSPRDVLLNYLLSIPFFFSRIIPPACLLATLFSLNRLRSRSELIVMSASGFSRRNIALAIAQIASVVMVVQFINVAYLDPWCKKLHKHAVVNSEKKFKYIKSMGLASGVGNSGKIWYRSKKEYYITYSVYDKYQKILIQPTLFYFNERYQNTKIIRADRAQGDDQGVWSLYNVQIVEDIAGDSFPRLIKKDRLQLSLHEVPADFDRIDDDLTTLDLIDLMEFVAKIKKSGISPNEYEILLLERFAHSVACLIFALAPIGIIFAPNPRASSFGKNIIFAILFTLGYWTIYGAAIALGNASHIPPLIATFGLSFLLALYFFYRLVIKER